MTHKGSNRFSSLKCGGPPVIARCTGIGWNVFGGIGGKADLF